MPHDDDAERAVLTSMLMSSKAIAEAQEIIKLGDEFYNRVYGIIYDTIVEMENNGLKVDPVTLKDKLGEKEVTAEVASLKFLMDIMKDSSSSTSANVTYYAQIVHKKAESRSLIKAAESIAEEGYRDDTDVQDLFNVAEKRIYDATQSRIVRDIRPIDEVFFDALTNVSNAYRMQGNITGLATGFTDLDFFTSGFQRSDFILIAARPSMGKTAFALNIAEHMALKNGNGVGIFSLEMSSTQLANRLMSMNSRVSVSLLRSGKISGDDYQKITESGTLFGRSGLFIDDTPGISVAELRSKCRRLKSAGKLDIIFIDYLQLMTGSGRAESRQQEVSQISRELKGLARELDIPVVALSQLSRTVESRKPPKPMLSDLRESGAIEQDADVVMFIYREDYYNKDTKRKNVSDIIIAKQRNGPVDEFPLVWLPEYTKFANMSKDEKEKLKSHGEE
ncbi:MAG: replicative DNA helicase [Lachnospiraceae bacterium]|nr:replicative DNA helicase [Lachnospiraceae bacterium]MBP3266338.1 replicative DNA helicase [Clostridiales bacterium]MBP3755226.1 replicative DNA helicase [Lachnospiraceae bacterium]